METNFTRRLLRLGWALPLLLLAATAAAETYRIPSPTPRAMEEILRVVEEEIPDTRDAAGMCGGWTLDEGVGTKQGPGGKISLVTGAPGRKGEPLRNLLSGMAWRVETGGTENNGFLFPNGATGLSTTCDKATRAVMRWIWEPRDRREAGRYVLQEVENPYFEDPPCDAHPDAEGIQSPAECEAFCSWLNTFTYEDCQVFERLESGEWACHQTGRKYTCSEEWMTWPVIGSSRPASSERSSRGFSESSDSSDFFASSKPGDSSSSFSFSAPIGASSSSQSGASSSFSFSQGKSSVPSQSSQAPASSSSFSFQFPVGPSSQPTQTPSSFSFPQFSSEPFIIPAQSSQPKIDVPPVDLPTFIPGNPAGPQFPPQQPPAAPPVDPAVPPKDDGGFFDTLFQFFTGFRPTSLVAQIDDDPVLVVPDDDFEFPGEEREPDDPVTVDPSKPDDGASSSESDDGEENGEDEPEIVVAEGGFVPNCVPCEGQECRCFGPNPDRDCFQLDSRTERMGDPSPMPARNRKLYPSYFRAYAIETERDSLLDLAASKDVLRETEMEAACYGFYEEFDPKTKNTAGASDGENPGERSRRCAIAFPHRREELLETQSVAIRTSPDPPAAPSAMPRREPGDTWYPILGGMSFLREDANVELDEAFLRLDAARMLAAPAIADDRPLAEDLALQGGDDGVTNETGAAQPVLQWIHEMQDDMAELLSPPVVRLRIPAAWLPEIDPDAILSIEDAEEEAAEEEDAEEDDSEIDETYDPRVAAIDVQLRAGTDLRGVMISHLNDMFSVEDEIVPAVIPAGSPREFLDRALQWKNYIRRREMLGLPYPSEAWLVVAKLQEYAVRIARYQGLRAQLDETIAALAADREQNLAAVAEWMEETVESYRAFEERRAERLAMAPLVLEVQGALSDFSDKHNFAWCRQDGLTTPIYSLLHAWLPGSPKLSPALSCDGGEQSLPLPCVPDERDLFLDLSMLAAASARLRVPVLHPIQVLPDLPAPPGENDPPPDPRTLLLPDLPPLPTIDASLLAGAGTVDVESLPEPLELPEPLDLARVRTALERARAILAGRNEAYAEFWESLEPPEETFFEMIGLSSGADSDERLSCDGWNESPCVHVEMDLDERVTRATAAPGVRFREHLLIRGRRRIEAMSSREETAVDLNRTVACDPAHDLCTPPLHRVIRPPATGIRIAPPEAGDAWDSAIDEIRARARRITIGDDGAEPRDAQVDLPFPYVGEPADLLPSFHVPWDVPLSPDIP